LVDYLLRTHLPGTIESRLSVEPEMPLLCGHYDALSRAFSNLLLNAAEAMGETGGTLLVRVKLLPGGRAEVGVRDSGPGIPPDLLPRIWEPDFTTRPRGTGLGLALVRQTVIAHCGTVSARNPAAGGAEICIVLPLDGTNAVPAGASFPPPAAGYLTTRDGDRRTVKPASPVRGTAF
jgi:two-component system sensor histidine kinase HydH